MPEYTFRCNNCGTDEYDYIFSITMSMKDYHADVPCDNCEKKDNVVRIYDVPSLHMDGLTISQKSAGVTKNRVDLGKMMRDTREKRKRAYDPGTREHDSNELWAGSHLPEGMKAPKR